MLRHRQAAIARRRALQAALRNNPGTMTADGKSVANHVTLPGALSLPESVYRDGSYAMPLPNDWSASAGNQNGSSFKIEASNGATPAQANLAVVALAPSANAVQPLPSEQRKMLGGVAHRPATHSDHNIITAGVGRNDRQREIGGHKVFEVIAQTPANAATKSDQVWNFYFTEINGRVYSLTTRSAAGATSKVSADAEQFLQNFRPNEPKR
jgi:hypothetical protein